jgi:hypothetical protein
MITGFLVHRSRSQITKLLFLLIFSLLSIFLEARTAVAAPSTMVVIAESTAGR